MSEDKQIQRPAHSEALAALRTQSVTLSMKDNVVKLQCECSADAEAILHWLIDVSDPEVEPNDDNEPLTYEWLFAQPRETLGGNQFFSGLLCFDWDDPLVNVSYYVRSRGQYYPIRRIRTRGEYRLLRKALNKIDVHPEDFDRVVSMSASADAFQHDMRKILGDSTVKDTSEGCIAKVAGINLREKPDDSATE